MDMPMVSAILLISSLRYDGSDEIIRFLSVQLLLFD